MIRNEGSFQSMLSIASFNFDMSDYEGEYEGVYVVFLVTADDSLCGNTEKPTTSRQGLLPCMTSTKGESKIVCEQVESVYRVAHPVGYLGWV